MRSGRRLPLLILITILVTGLTGCSKPARKPLPQSPDVYHYREPEITLYINHTGLRKKIKFEEYITGVVAAEMDSTWPQAALSAQAILARTFTLQKIRDDGGVPGHQADASTDPEEFQAYDPTRINDRVRQAVAITRGQVIKYQGRYVHAWFHANAGGKTATPAEGLDFDKEAPPYLKVVDDPGQKVARPEDKHWKASFPLDQVRNVVYSQTGRDPGAINVAAVKKRGPSGRAITLRLGGGTISGPALRLGLGSEAMRSTLLESIQIRNGRMVVSGRGYGHGVGMSQWGAYYLARKGFSVEGIVRYYYRGVEIDKIWR
jgi:stage II sporulation protein D